MAAYIHIYNFLKQLGAPYSSMPHFPTGSILPRHGDIAQLCRFPLITRLTIPTPSICVTPITTWLLLQVDVIGPSFDGRTAVVQIHAVLPTNNSRGVYLKGEAIVSFEMWFVSSRVQPQVLTLSATNGDVDYMRLCGVWYRTMCSALQ